MNILKIVDPLRRIGGALRRALPSEINVSAVLGLAAIGWGLWEWWGPGPSKVVVGVILLLNAAGLARKGSAG